MLRSHPSLSQGLAQPPSRLNNYYHRLLRSKPLKTKIKKGDSSSLAPTCQKRNLTCTFQYLYTPKWSAAVKPALSTFVTTEDRGYRSCISIAGLTLDDTARHPARLQDPSPALPNTQRHERVTLLPYGHIVDSYGTLASPRPVQKTNPKEDNFRFDLIENCCFNFFLFLKFFFN